VVAWLLVRLFVLSVDAVLYSVEKVFVLLCSGLGLVLEGVGLFLDGVGLRLDNVGLLANKLILFLDEMESARERGGLSRNRVGLLLWLSVFTIDVGLILDERVIVTAFRRSDPRIDARCNVSTSLIKSILVTIADNRLVHFSLSSTLCNLYTNF